MNIAPLNPHAIDAQALIKKSNDFMGALYPAESNHMESAAALALPNVYFIGLRIQDKLVGCAAVKTLQDDGTYGEVKRVFVLEEHRGNGLSKILMQHIEAHLKETGIKIARLETGVKQPEALGLYKKLGYEVRGPYGSYRPDPLSVFMEKRIEV